MAARRRDYGRIAENAALLGAQVAGYSVPIGPALGLLRATRGQRPATEDRAFVLRLLAQIDLWLTEHAELVAAVGGMPSGWQDRLLDRLATPPPADSAATAQLIATTVLGPPLIPSGQATLDAAVGELAAAVPELVIRAGAQQDAFAALRALFAGDLAKLDAKLEGLDPEVTPAVTVALVAGYLARLIDGLARDTWRSTQEASPASLAAIQRRLTLRRAGQGGDDRSVLVDSLAERCTRLVILGEPGAGKTWTARRIAIRAAESALEQLEAGRNLDDIEFPLFAACSQVLGPNDRPRWERLTNATLEWALTDPGQVHHLGNLLLRHERVLIVLDSLDEAADIDANALDRLVAARPLGAVRLVVTSRPGIPVPQFLHLDEADPGHQIGTLGSLTSDDIVSLQAAMRRRRHRPHTALPSDEASARDELGSADLVAQAIGDFLRDPETRPPVTVGIKGAWGGGKSSMMAMVREYIDPLTGQGGTRRGIRLDGDKRRTPFWVRVITRLQRRQAGLSVVAARYETDRDDEPDTATPVDFGGSADSSLWRPTVWFNPWHHQSSEQVWAGLATTIVSQVTDRMDRVDRERFFVRLNLARVDREAVRRSLYQALWRRVAVPLAILASVAGIAAFSWSLRWAAGGFSVASFGTILMAGVGLLRSPLSGIYPALVANPTYSRLAAERTAVSKLDAFLDDPGHDTQLGYAYLAYVDLKRVIDLVATPERPLVIFVDDLDRCSPSVVVQTLEALNLFLAGPFHNCSFVIALEPAVLATHIASAYESYAKAATSDRTEDHALSMGWRFLEKMIHLPVVVPRPSRDQVARYVRSLLPPTEPQQPVLARPGTGMTANGRSGPSSPSARADSGSMPNEAGADPKPVDISPRHAAVRVVAGEQLAQDLASTSAFHEACTWAAHELVTAFNPRQIKRLIALVHLYSLIALRLGYIDPEESNEELTRHIKEVSVLAALNVRWPQHVDELLGPVLGDPYGPVALEDLRERLSPDNAQETAAANSAGDQFPHDLRQFLTDHRRSLALAIQLTTIDRFWSSGTAARGGDI